MVDLVTLEFVKRALHVDHDDEDDVIQAHIETASDAILRYLRRSVESPGWDANSVPKAVAGAIVLAVKSLYDDEQAELLSGLASSDPKNPLVALLCMLRKPTAA